MSHFEAQSDWSSPGGPEGEESLPQAAARGSGWLWSVGGYGLALALVWYLLRGVSFRALVSALAQARVSWFIAATVAGFVCNLAGETFLFSRLFTYLRKRTGFGEMLALNASQYFLQLVNVVAASGTFALLVSRRKRIGWLEASFTLAFQGFVDLLVIVGMLAATRLLLPSLAVPLPWYLPFGALAVLVLGAWFWLRGRPNWMPLRWLYERRSLGAFRRARLADYRRLGAIRAGILLVQGAVLYLQMRSFRLPLSLAHVLALYPGELLATSVPLTPAGLGVEQAAIVLIFGAFCEESALLAMSLARNIVGVLLRVVAGLVFTPAVAKEMVRKG